MPSKETPEEIWRRMLTGQYVFYRKYRRLLGLLPSRRRCKNCHAPMTGFAGIIMRLFAHGPYNKNPRFCNW